MMRPIRLPPQSPDQIEALSNASTHQDDDVEAVFRAAAGRLVLLYLPTYGP